MNSRYILLVATITVGIAFAAMFGVARATPPSAKLPRRSPAARPPTSSC